MKEEVLQRKTCLKYDRCDRGLLARQVVTLYNRAMRNRPGSKTTVLIIGILLVLIGFAFYYATALRNADNPHTQTEQAS